VGLRHHYTGRDQLAQQDRKHQHQYAERGFELGRHDRLSYSLRLRIYTPDGYVLGPYFDNADGTVDGRINLDIYNPDGIAKGTWRYEVYGHSVVGTEDYYI